MNVELHGPFLTLFPYLSRDGGFKANFPILFPQATVSYHGFSVLKFNDDQVTIESFVAGDDSKAIPIFKENFNLADFTVDETNIESSKIHQKLKKWYIQYDSDGPKAEYDQKAGDEKQWTTSGKCKMRKNSKKSMLVEGDNV